MKNHFPSRSSIAFTLTFFLLASIGDAQAQSRRLTAANIDSAIAAVAPALARDSLRPAFHLTPPAGCMGDPNGGIYHEGWYHIFYGLYPFAFHPGGWYWAHARSKDLLHWEPMPTGLTPAFDLGLQAVGSGSTIAAANGDLLAFHSQSKDGPMQFWRAVFTDSSLSAWRHEGKNPVLRLDHPGLPPFDGFWRDPFVFSVQGRTFLIACADLFEEDYVPVPLFEAKNEELTEWEYKGNLFTVPKRRYRNLEVPELRPLGDKWIFLASTDAPVDRVNYWIGEFDLERLRFLPQATGPVDYSGHYYAQETLLDDRGNLFLMGWMPGWDREWLPTYMNEPLKNSDPLWNGCFAFPRRLLLQDGQLLQRPVAALAQLREAPFQWAPRELPVDGPMTGIVVVEGFQGDQLEIQLALELQYASFCGVNVLCDPEGQGGLPIVWSGETLNVDGVEVPIREWAPGQPLRLQILVDKKFVEVFVNDGRYCITRQLREEHIGGKQVALTSLGGTAKLLSFAGWKLRSLH